MGLIDVASWHSKCAGLDYYEEKRVIECKKVGDGEYSGKVKGEKIYDVTINTIHPRSSSCNCPFACDRRVICKHQIALLFKANPKEAREFKEFIKQQEEEYEEYQLELESRLDEYLDGLTKQELKGTLMDVLNDAPEWVYDNLIRRTIGW